MESLIEKETVTELGIKKTYIAIDGEEFETMAAEVKSKDGYTLHYLEAV